MVTSDGGSAPVNRILEGLSRADVLLVADSTESVSLVAGDVVSTIDKKISHVYFPRVGVVSLFAATQEGFKVGAGIVGADGMLGMALAAGRSSSTLSATSQGHGSGDRMTADRFVSILAQSAGLRGALLLYGYELVGTDGAERGLHRLSQCRATARSLDARRHRRLARRPAVLDPGGHRDRPRRAAPGRQPRGELAAAARPHPLPAWRRQHPRSSGTRRRRVQLLCAGLETPGVSPASATRRRGRRSHGDAPAHGRRITSSTAHQRGIASSLPSRAPASACASLALATTAAVPKNSWVTPR